MTDATRFLASLPPYNSLSSAEISRLAARLERLEFAADQQIYRIDDKLLGLFLIESGLVEITDRSGAVLSELGPHDFFGERGLLANGFAATSARALAQTELYVLPADELLPLIRSNAAVAGFFDKAPKLPALNDLAKLRIGDMTRGQPVSCPADTAIAEAARLMRDRNISSLGVTDGERLVGIVTVRDFCNRVVAEGRDAGQPVAAIMTPDPISLPPDALGLDVLRLMAERRIGHLPVVQSGQLVGMITQTDLTRIQATSAAAMLEEIARAEDVTALALTARQIPQLLMQLVGANHRHEVVTRMITDIADAITCRLIVLAETRLGPAPCAWVWAACGSQGRQEQTGVSDQDNCIIMADGADASDPWFHDLARFVSDGLNECGYIYCPGDMMATNDRWRQPLSVWSDYFRSWIELPTPEAQMLASVMFDLRAIYGSVDLVEGMREKTLELASKNSIFVAHMTANALTHRPPLGLIGGLATIRSGEHRDRLDLKHNGVAPISELARIYALEGRIEAVNTRARLTEARQQGVISDKGGSDLIAAYDMIQTTRLYHQSQQVRSGQRPDNFMAPSALPDLERSHLRDAFVVVRRMQSAAGQSKGTLR